jgi:hypothetical protein
MRRIDELFTTWPFLGSRRKTALLRAEGHASALRVWSRARGGISRLACPSFREKLSTEFALARMRYA